MATRSYLGDLLSELETTLEAGGRFCPRETEVLLTLSKIQRSLYLRKIDSVERELYLCSLGSINIGMLWDIMQSMKLLSRQLILCTKLTQGCLVLQDQYQTLLQCLRGTCSNDLHGLTLSLVAVLACESDHSGHAAAKALVALSSYLDEMPCLWSWILNYFWSTLKSFCLESLNSLYIHRKRWMAVMRATQLLHAILRGCKEGASKLRTFLSISGVQITSVVASFIKHFPEHDINPSEHTDAESLALGAMLQLLCSIVHALDHELIIGVEVTINNEQILTSVDTFVSAFSCHCLRPKIRSCISNYQIYKFLMLLFRSREWFLQKPCLALTCLKILRTHSYSLFGSLFQRPLINPLFDSPFIHTVTQGSDRELFADSYICQSERHATLLLFKTIVALKRKDRESSKAITEGLWDGLQEAKEQCAALDLWLLNLLIFQMNQMPENSSLHMADSLAFFFLQIFIGKDTLMLEMLLLLLEWPKLDANLLSDATDNALLTASNLLMEVFNPLRMFAVFFAEVCYDHSVILDFLISKDTSVLCLQYLMRSLYLILDSWPDFVLLSNTVSSFSDIKRTSKRKRKLESLSDQIQSCIKDREESSLTYEHIIDTEKVAGCLQSLNSAVRRLHERHTFPYNPSPLLRRLDSFEQLWMCNTGVSNVQ